ncbi:MAG TPA: FHA domain-containing protein [Hyphomicrobiaceae bacterium]|nr:FHA domain-containing protein [Hyphomicrobiaceae bacterium]
MDAWAFDVKKIEASVYKIYTMRKKGIGTGTGFLVNGRRILVTNYHVVADGEKYFVGYRDGGDGKLVEARVVERRSNIDLAILEAYEDLPGGALTLADFEPEKLTSVVAVGFPGAADVKQDTAVHNLPELFARMREPSGFDSTLTPGMVSRIYSATNTALSETQIINARTVQHNAPINPGNSGGPLFDECGTVVGVNSFSPKDAQGLFFSIHSGEVIRFLRELNISYEAVGHPCLAASLSSGGGMVLPLIIGMAVALAAVAVVFAWRGGAAVGAVSQYMSRRLTGLRQRAPARGGRDTVRQPAAQINLAQTAAALSLQPLAGGRSFALEAGCTVVLGRGRQCEVVLADDTVSSSHARLEANGPAERVAVTDLNSSNGTFLNGKRITSGQAQVGDVLRFGNAEFQLTAGGARPPSAPNLAWMLSGFDPSGRALQFELRLPAPNGKAPEAATWTIGRDRNRAQFVIDDDSVSGAHAQITYDARQGLMLRDLGSTNGTRVDGAALGARVIALSDAGQEIAFGAAKLRLSRVIR